MFGVAGFLALARMLVSATSHDDDNASFVNDLASNASVEATSTCGLVKPQRFCHLAEIGTEKGLRCDMCDAFKENQRHPANSVLLGDRAHWWQSAVGKEKVNFTLDFGQVVHVGSLVLRAGPSPRPRRWKLLRSVDGSRYFAWKWFAESKFACRRMVSDVQLRAKHSFGQPHATCDSKQARVHPLHNGEIFVDLITGHRGNWTFSENDAIQDWTRARYVRFQLQKLHSLEGIHFPDGNEPYTFRQLLFYSLSSVEVFGLCPCDPHWSRECSMTPSLKMSFVSRTHCECMGNTCGPRCTKCCPGFYRVPDPNTRFVCRECNCNQHSKVCIYDPNIGTSKDYRCLDCQNNTMGQTCQECISGFRRVPISESVNVMFVCEACNCSIDGSMDLFCNHHTGRCSCHFGFAGDLCDQCTVGYWGYPKCQECQCNGAHMEPNMCDPITGKCHCHGNLTGKNCDQCPHPMYLIDSKCLFCSPCQEALLQNVRSLIELLNHGVVPTGEARSYPSISDKNHLFRLFNTLAKSEHIPFWLLESQWRTLRERSERLHAEVNAKQLISLKTAEKAYTLEKQAENEWLEVTSQFKARKTRSSDNGAEILSNWRTIAKRNFYTFASKVVQEKHMAKRLLEKVQKMPLLSQEDRLWTLRKRLIETEHNLNYTSRESSYVQNVVDEMKRTIILTKTRLAFAAEYRNETKLEHPILMKSRGIAQRAHEIFQEVQHSSTKLLEGLRQLKNRCKTGKLELPSSNVVTERVRYSRKAINLFTAVRKHLERNYDNETLIASPEELKVLQMAINMVKFLEHEATRKLKKDGTPVFNSKSNNDFFFTISGDEPELPLTMIRTTNPPLFTERAHAFESLENEEIGSGLESSGMFDDHESGIRRDDTCSNLGEAFSTSRTASFIRSVLVIAQKSQEAGNWIGHWKNVRTQLDVLSKKKTETEMKLHAFSERLETIDNTIEKLQRSVNIKGRRKHETVKSLRDKVHQQILQLKDKIAKSWKILGNIQAPVYLDESYLQFALKPEITTSSVVTIVHLDVRPSQPDGIILMIAPSNETFYFTISLNHWHLEVIACINGICHQNRSRSTLPKYQWSHLKLERVNHEVKLIFNSQEKDSLHLVLFHNGSFFPAWPLSPTLSIGGKDSSFRKASSLTGCVQNVHINGDAISLLNPTATRGSLRICQNPDRNEKQANVISWVGSNYYRIKNLNITTRYVHLNFWFRTARANSTLLTWKGTRRDTLRVKLHSGAVHALHNSSTETTMLISRGDSYHDLKWHRVEVSHVNNSLSLSVDQKDNITAAGFNWETENNIYYITIGGPVPEDNSYTKTTHGMTCIKDLTVGSFVVPLESVSSNRSQLEICQFPINDGFHAAIQDSSPIYTKKLPLNLTSVGVSFRTNIPNVTLFSHNTSTGEELKVLLKEGLPNVLLKGQNNIVNIEQPKRLDDGKWHNLYYSLTFQRLYLDATEFYVSAENSLAVTQFNQHVFILGEKHPVCFRHLTMNNRLMDFSAALESFYLLSPCGL